MVDETFGHSSLQAIWTLGSIYLMLRAMLVRSLSVCSFRYTAGSEFFLTS